MEFENQSKRMAYKAMQVSERSEVENDGARMECDDAAPRWLPIYGHFSQR